MTISESCYNQSQSWIFERFLIVPRHPEIKLWIKIERNAYDHQSWARVKKWSGIKWEDVYEEPILSCICKKISYVQDNVRIQDFESDYNRLLENTLKIIL